MIECIIIAERLRALSRRADNFGKSREELIEEIVMIAITAAATFALLDMYAPSIGNAARQGTGFGIGANLSGFPQMA